MSHSLRVEHMPLSWCEEGEKGKGGYRLRSISVGRRVWGTKIGQALFSIEGEGQRLILRDMRDGGRIIQAWPKSSGYDSPWGGEGQSKLVQIAEWYEAREFNAWLDDMRKAQDDRMKHERLGIHAEVRWDADGEGRPTLHCVDCGEAWHDTRNGLVIVELGDGWCKTHGHIVGEDGEPT